MIDIPQPVAIPGDEVHAHNYKKKGNQWEDGECLDSDYHVSRGGSGSWQYRVRLHRRTPSQVFMGREYGNNTLILYVGDDGIEKRGDNE